VRVLISAYACNPFKGSEEGVGWGWIKAISKYHTLDVITAEFHRGDIENALSQDVEFASRVRFYFVPRKIWHYQPTNGWLWIEGSIFKPIMNIAYNLWQREAFRLGEELHQKIGFDLVHQLTYVGFRFPGKLWKLNIPFVWGPIGGLENTSWRFLPIMGMSGALYYAGRNIINTLQLMMLPGPKRAFSKARGRIIAATEGIRKEIYRWYCEDSQVICEIGPPPDKAIQPSLRDSGERLKIAWSGLHLPGKALPLLLNALAQLPKETEWILDILGDGPCTNRWKLKSKKLRIEDRCNWHGRVPRNKALEIIRNSHVFIITSLKDLTSSVLMEALAQGVPVICPDHCGFSNVVTYDCGIKIPVENPAQISSGIAAAITKLDQDERERRRLATGALLRIDEFTWDKKALAIDAIYTKARYDSI